MCFCILPAWPEVKVNEITTAANLLPPHHPLGLMSHSSAVAAVFGDTHKRADSHTLSVYSAQKLHTHTDKAGPALLYLMCFYQSEQHCWYKGQTNPLFLSTCCFQYNHFFNFRVYYKTTGNKSNVASCRSLKLTFTTAISNATNNWPCGVNISNCYANCLCAWIQQNRTLQLVLRCVISYWRTGEMLRSLLLWKHTSKEKKGYHF